MNLAIGILFLLFASTTKTVHAQSSNIPIFYQLIEAYKPYQSQQYGSPVQIIPQSITQAQISPPAQPNQINTPGNITIAVLGDSMVDTLGENIPKLSYSLSKYYPNKSIKILNYGYGSSTLEYAYTRLLQNYVYKDKTISSLISQSPDILIIESFAYNNFGNTQTGFDKQNGLLDQIIKTTREKLPKTKILLAATIAPNSVFFANNGQGSQFSSLDKIEKTSTIKKYLENHIRYAQDKHLPIANAYHPTLLNNDGQRAFIDTTDNIHPSSYGNEFFCDTLAKALFDNHLLD